MQSLEFDQTVQWVGRGLDVLGIAIIVGGTVTAMIVYAIRFFRDSDRLDAYEQGRRSLGRAILFGLEVFIAGDIIRTVAISPTFQNVGVLGLIVLVRTFLSTTLEVEIEGRWPWQGGESRSLTGAVEARRKTGLKSGEAKK